MKRSNLIAALSAAAIVLTGMPLAAAAQDVITYRPQTAAAGAPVDPSFWNNQAMVRLNGVGGQVNNFTVAPTSSSYYDYSNRYHNDTTNYAGGQTNDITTHIDGDQVTNNNGDQSSTTHVNGGQTNVNAQGNFEGPGSNFTVTTGNAPPN